MQLCFIANANLTHTGRWIRPLVQRGHRVELISYTSVQHTIDGVRTIDLTRLNNTPKIRFFIWANWVRRHLNRTHPDVLHVHQVQAAGWLGWLSGYHPLVISAWGSDLLKEPHKNAFRRWLVVRTLSTCDRLIAPSPVLAQAAIKLGLGESRVAPIPWGINTTVFTPAVDDRLETRQSLGLSQDDEVIFCPRSLTPLYRIRQVIEAVIQVALYHSRVRLILLEYNPDPDYVRSLKQLATQAGLQKCLMWLPAVRDDREMARLYRAADIMVSIPTSEGFGLSVFEALACGTPAIISDLPVFDEVLQHGVNAWKIQPEQEESLDQALVHLLDEPGLRARLAEGGRDLGNRLSSHMMADQAEAMYAEVISEYAKHRHAALK